MSWSQADVWRLFSSCGEQSLKDRERIEGSANEEGVRWLRYGSVALV